MPYTLMKGLAWIALALLLGIVIGWLLRSVAAKRQVARARSHQVDTAEIERLQGRVANLEPVVAERDRLRAELDVARLAREKSSPPGQAPARFTDVATLVVSDADDGGASTAAGGAAGMHGNADGAAEPPDLTAGASVLGRSISLDDLKLIEGIGPKVEELCRGIGIVTWRDLADTEVSLLRTMLVDAGPRFRTHDPATWPHQAQLLADGRWEEFKALTESLDGGKGATSPTGG